MMATSLNFPSEESLPHPPQSFQTTPINTKQAVIYNKSGTKCMNIVKDSSGMPLSPTSPSTRDQNDISPSHSPQNNNGTTKKKKKKKGKRKPPVDHVEESDTQVNGSHNNHVKSHQVNYNSENEEEALDVDIEEDDEFFSDDDGYDPEAPEIPFPRKDSIANHDGDNHVPTTPSKKKKKKKKNKNGLSANQIDIHHNHSHHNHNHKSRKDGIWNTNNNEERQRIREFWLQLGEEERRSLVKVEKEAVLKKMKEQQKHSCSCSVCGKKRTAIEAELETLYDAYYEELESYANQQQFGSSNIEYRNDAEYDDDEDDDEYEDDEDEDEEDYEGSEHDSDTRKEFFNFGNSLTVKGGILTVADDLLKNDGKKFLEMMERLAERRMQREEEAAAMERDYYEEEEEEDDDEYEEDGEEDNQTEEQRMEEGRRMFQIFAAKMFEQRVLNAYREKVAQERQQKLLEELEEENRLKEEREQKKLKEKEKKKAKNRALKQERARKEAEKLAEEKAQRAERERKLEEERKRREEERLKREAERRARDEERQRREEEKRRKAKEEKEREERRKKEQEAKERKEREKEERERKEREEKARKEKEERRQREERERKQRELKEKERKEREEQERKEREKKEREAKERERKEKEEQERKDREEKERKEKEEKQRASVPPLRQQQHHERKRTVPPIGQPSAQPPPPISTPVVQNKPVVSIPNGMNWMNYSSHEHQPLPQHSINPHVINSHLPPPPNHPSHPNHPPPHPLFNPGGPQAQFGGQPVGIMNGPAGMTNEVVNEVFTNTKKVINPPPQGTNTLQGISPTSSLFATGLGPIGMGVHPHHGGPPVPMHAHQVIRQMPPPRGFNQIAPPPHLPGPSGVPPSVASTNLSLLNEAGVTQANAFGGIPIQGPLGTQTFNLGSQVVNQPASSHMGPSVVVPNTPLAPIGHRRMSQHPEDSHVKAVQRPQPIQRPRKNSGTGHSLEVRTRSPPPGFGNMVGSGALLDDQTHPMANRRQSLAPGESSYFSNSLFSTAMSGEPNPSQSSQNQQQQQHGTNRLSHRPVVGDNEWLRGRQGVTDNLLGESVSIGGNNNGGNNIGTTDIWGSNYVGQSMWYPEGNNNPTNRRVMGSRDFGIP